jgi:hypothetical protein
VLSLQPLDRHLDKTAVDLAAQRNQSHCKGYGLGQHNSLIKKCIFKHVMLKWAKSLKDFRQMAGEMTFSVCNIEPDRSQSSSFETL